MNRKYVEGVPRVIGVLDADIVDPSIPRFLYITKACAKQDSDKILPVIGDEGEYLPNGVVRNASPC
jgi:hypothetical protein